jgi:hypothetical protein
MDCLVTSWAGKELVGCWYVDLGKVAKTVEGESTFLHSSPNMFSSSLHLYHVGLATTLLFGAPYPHTGSQMHAWVHVHSISCKQLSSTCVLN